MDTTYEIRHDGTAIFCRLCERTSHNANDVSQRYCGSCKVFHLDDAFVWFAQQSPVTCITAQHYATEAVTSTGVDRGRVLALMIRCMHWGAVTRPEGTP